MAPNGYFYEKKKNFIFLTFTLTFQYDHKCLVEKSTYNYCPQFKVTPNEIFTQSMHIYIPNMTTSACLI